MLPPILMFLSSLTQVTIPVTNLAPKAFPLFVKMIKLICVTLMVLSRAVLRLRKGNLDLNVSQIQEVQKSLF